MRILKVPDMHCEKCVVRISRALTAAGIAFQVSLADRTVAVEDGKTAAAMEALDDLGFTPEE